MHWEHTASPELGPTYKFSSQQHCICPRTEDSLPDALVGQQLMEILPWVHHRLQTQPCTFQSHYLRQEQQLLRHTWLVLLGTETVQTNFTKTEQLDNFTQNQIELKSPIQNILFWDTA
jgi:hypothetical protein